ncbi:hypothetical protein HLB44_09065 [Aquincola sp. S2]|uniref:PEP-CTERM sorting domain-containing protein n=1 Tax=Pseudaquabacterium terrae TaxID=2732868 RepID=A0ABX2EES9_9BURK|nr:hypothetical protein [Aquabacterium terrae]NRF67130.1 hypothetical protein [Aquabacterium terrae]
MPTLPPGATVVPEDKKMLKRAAWAAVIAAMVGGTAQAAVVTLHDESTQGDITSTTPFVLANGQSQVRGSTAAFWAPGVGGPMDFDHVQFRVAAGSTLVGIEFAYDVTSTRGNAKSTIRQAYSRGDSTQVVEDTAGGAAYAGVASLFDDGGFRPISGDDGYQGNITLGFSMLGFNMALPGEHGATSWVNHYTLTFLVEPAAVPLPGTLALSALALVALAGATARRRTG